MADAKSGQGATKQSGQTSIAVARFLPDGSADPSFNNGHGLIINIKGYDETATGVGIDAQGGIFVAGYAMDSNPPHEAKAVIAIKLQDTGALDAKYAHSGISFVKPPHTGVRNAKANAVALDDKGRALIVGTAMRKSSDGAEKPRMLFMRLTNRGALDHTFGEDGIIIADWAGSTQALLIRPDGKIVVCGAAEDDASKSDFVCVTLKENGNVVDKGIVKTNFGPDSDSHACSLFCDDEGRVTLAGYTRFGEGSHFAAARFKSDGYPDVSFGGKGRIVTEFNVGASSAKFAGRLGDKTVVAGRIALNSVGIARYNPNGELDETFSGDGKMAISPPRIPDTKMADAVITQKGETIICGTAEKKMSLMSFNRVGDLSTAFGKQGIVLFDDFTYANGEALAGTHIAGGAAIGKDSKDRLLVVGSYISY